MVTPSSIKGPPLSKTISLQLGYSYLIRHCPAYEHLRMEKNLANDVLHNYDISQLLGNLHLHVGPLVQIHLKSTHPSITDALIQNLYATHTQAKDMNKRGASTDQRKGSWVMETVIFFCICSQDIRIRSYFVF